MGKIGDLFVRLGLKSDDYKKGIKGAKKETQGFGASLGKMKAGALAVWAAIGTAVVKFGKDFIAATNKIGDAWNRQMSAMKAGYHTFLASLSNIKVDTSNGVGGFFKSLFGGAKETASNIKESADAAREMTKAFDAEFELVNSVKLQREAIQEELNNLYIAMRDTTLSASARQAAANKYKALLQPIADAEVEVYGNMMEKAMAAWQAGTGLSRNYSTAEMTEFFSKIGTEYDKMASKFPELMNVYENMKGDAQNQPIFDIIATYQQAANQMSDIDKTLARTTNSIKATLQRELEGIAATVATYGQEKLDLDLELEIDLKIDEAEIEAGMAEVDAYMGQFISDWNDKCMQIKELNDMLEASFVQSMSGGVQAFTDALFGLEGAGAEQILAALLQPFAQTAIQLGEMLIAQGVAVSAFKKSLDSLDGAVAIAAGVALIAVGSAVSAGIKSLAGGSSGGTTATSSAGSASPSGGVETYEQEITVHVVGEISGNNIVLAGQKTLNKWNR